MNLGGDEAGDPSRRGGLGVGSGEGNSGGAGAGQGRGDGGEVAGDGSGNGSGRGGGGAGRGGRGQGGKGRTGRGRSRGGDPFGNGGSGGGTGGYGSGKANGKGSGDGGTGTGPTGGPRLARRDLGDGNGDGGDNQFGRGGSGSGKGTGQGTGDGNGRAATGTGAGGGRGAEENADREGDGKGRTRRGRGGHRAGETEDQMGRGIWGGFKVNFYQDKSDHPDLPDATFHPGNPIDWPVFTTLATKKTIPNLDFDWGATPPAPGMKSTFWSLKATGRIFVPKDDTYEFFFDELDDAGKLVLDGKKIIEVWQVQKSSPSSGKMFLTRGPHDIQIEYVQGPATAASIKLSWRSTSFTKEIVGVYQAPKG